MDKFAASDGLRLSYISDDYTDPWRKSDTLVMLHAAMGGARRFYAWVPHVARDFRVVRLELRGHGESEIPGPTQLTFERLWQDVVELLDHLGVERAHLMGSSAGAFVCSTRLRFARGRRGVQRRILRGDLGLLVPSIGCGDGRGP